MASNVAPVKVAVIGSGLAGLAAAYYLAKAAAEDGIHGLEVHLFEKASSLGMDSSSISIPVDKHGNEWRVDVPMRSFQGGYYPELIKLYKSLGVRFKQADFSYSFSLLTGCKTIETTMIYDGASGRAGISMPSIYAKNLNASWLSLVSNTLPFLVMMLHVIYNYLRLLFMAVPALRDPKSDKMSFREWALYSAPQGWLSRRCGMVEAWETFILNVLVPLFSAVCTAPEEDVFDHPMQEFLDYIWLTFGTHHYVVENGVKEVVAKLVEGLNPAHIHLTSPITAIVPSLTSPELADVQCMSSSYGSFRHVIFATQANGAAPILQAYASLLPDKSLAARNAVDLANCLRMWHYCRAIVINHTDGSLMPTALRDHRDLNLIRMDPSRRPEKTAQTMDENCVSSSYTMTTHVIQPPRIYPSDMPPVYQTTNPFISPKTQSILSVARLERAVLTNPARAALHRLCVSDESRRKSTPFWGTCRVEGPFALGDLQGAGSKDSLGIWVCGSYATPGIPLLEGCVVSARNVVYQGILQSLQ